MKGLAACLGSYLQQLLLAEVSLSHQSEAVVQIVEAIEHLSEADAVCWEDLLIEEAELVPPVCLQDNLVACLALSDIEEEHKEVPYGLIC